MTSAPPDRITADSYRDLFRLDSVVAVVTGAGRGLGRAMALALASAGADLGLIDIDEASAAETGALVQEMGRQALCFQVDVNQPTRIKPCLEQVELQLGTPTVLVNNAGVTSNDRFEDLPAADWHKVMDVNLSGVFHMSQAFGRSLIEQGLAGSLINIASISGLVGNRGGFNSHYCASKGAVIALTRSLAVEWAPHKIRVNAIAPGYFETPMTDRLKDRDESFYRQLIDRVPLGRFGRGTDLAGAVIFLASQASGFMTGHTLVVDGGYTAW